MASESGLGLTRPASLEERENQESKMSGLLRLSRRVAGERGGVRLSPSWHALGRPRLRRPPQQTPTSILPTSSAASPQRKQTAENLVLQ